MSASVPMSFVRKVPILAFIVLAATGLPAVSVAQQIKGPDAPGVRISVAVDPSFDGLWIVPEVRAAESLTVTGLWSEGHAEGYSGVSRPARAIGLGWWTMTDIVDLGLHFGAGIARSAGSWDPALAADLSGVVPLWGFVAGVATLDFLWLEAEPTYVGGALGLHLVF